MTVANPGEAESVRVGTTPKFEGARESDRLTGQLKRRNPWLRFRLFAPSLRSIGREHGNELVFANFHELFLEHKSESPDVNTILVFNLQKVSVGLRWL